MIALETIFQPLFRVYVITFLIILLAIMLAKNRQVPSISECMSDNSWVSEFILLNLITFAILFFFGFCCNGTKTLFEHYLLIPIVIIIYLFDCNNHVLIHNLAFLTYIVLVLRIIILQNLSVYCTLFLFIPLIAIWNLGIAEIIFLLCIVLMIR